MLTRLNTSTEISIFPTALGNHEPTGTRRLIPPGRKRIPLNHSYSTSSRNSVEGDPNAPEANMSMRAQREYFGPDVLIILGIIMASGGAILSLISFYCEFKHPAIQATMEGIGPSLVAIGMLFCVLRLFFCNLNFTRLCCQRVTDGLRNCFSRCPFVDKLYRVFPGKKKKKVHPLQKKTTVNVSSVLPNKVVPPNKIQIIEEQSDNAAGVKSNKGAGNLEEGLKGVTDLKQKAVTFNPMTVPSQESAINISPSLGEELKHFQTIENSSLWEERNEDLRVQIRQKETSLGDYSQASITDFTEELIGQSENGMQASVDTNFTNSEIHKNDEDILRDEIAILDEMKHVRGSSANTNARLNQTINELVLSQAK